MGTSNGSAASACPTCGAAGAVTCTCWCPHRPTSLQSRTSCSGSSPPPAASRSPPPVQGAARACSRACALPLASAGITAAAVAIRAAAISQVFVDAPGRPLLSDDDAHHLGRVLRLRDGEEVVAADGRGRWARALWRGTATLEPISAVSGIGGDGSVQSEAQAEPALTVAFAPVKGERPEWVVQKLTELGIDRIVPLHTERSVVRWTGSRGLATVEKLCRVAREAAAQCRRVWLPEISDTVAFADLPTLGGPGA